MSKFDGNQGIEEYDSTEQKPRRNLNIKLIVLIIVCLFVLGYFMHV